MKRTSASFFTTLTLFFLFITGAFALQAQAAPFAYIANSGSNSISIINTATNSVSQTVSTPGAAPYGVAINPAGTRVYLTNPGNNSISVLDTSTNTIIATIPSVGVHPHCVAINQAGTKAYAAADGNNTITVIDTATNTVVDTIPSAGNGLFSLVVNSTGSKIYATNMNDGTVSVIDTATKAVSSILVEAVTTLFGIAFNPEGSRAYVANYSSGSISVIDTSNDTVIQTVTGIPSARGVSVNPEGTRVYVTNFTTPGTVSVINTSDNTVVATVPVGDMPISVSLNPEGTKAYVVNYFGGVSVIDTSSNGVISTIPVGASPVSQGQFIGPNMCTPPPANMTAWWGGDNNALDMAGTNHGTLINGTTFVAGKVNQAFSLDGEDDYVEVVGNETGAFGSSAFSVDFWMYANNNGSNTYLMGKSNPDGGTGWDVRLDNNAIQVIGVNGWGINITSDASVTAGAWHHVSISATDTQVNLYIDGVIKGTCPRSTISTTTNPFRIGDTSNFGGTAFNGRIDEVDVFNRALTSEEIAAIFNAGSAGKCRSCTPAPADMAAWWQAENNAEDNISTHDGTLVNGATYGAGKVNQAFSFDGINDYMSVPASNAWAFGTGDFSIEFWAYGSTNDDRRPLINNRHSTPGTDDMWAIEIYNVANRVEFHSGTTILLTATNLLTSSTWNHIAVTRSGTTLSIYINGIPSGSTNNTNDFSAINDLQIGRDLLPSYQGDLGKTYQGLIDELSIFQRALTADEIAAIYNAGSTGQCDIDTTPDDFTFTDQTGVNVSTVITSNPITVSGINYATDISIAFCSNTSCEYKINSGGWTSSAGTVNNGDTVTVRQTSSNGYSTSTDLNLAIGSKIDTFRVSTMEPPQYSVTPSQTGSGTIDPSTPQSVTHGSYTTFTVTPDAGHSVSMGGTCNGTLTGATYATDAIIADCTVIATFTPNTYTVTPSKSGTGTITPTTPQTFTHGNSATFTVTPDTGHSVSMSGTCGGTLVDTTYTTDAVTADCTVIATFTPNTYTVTPSKTGSGTITPATPQTINHGSTTTFTVTPSAGYSASVNGTCGGTLTGATYTTNAVTSSCTVIATFTLNTYTFTITKTGTGSGTVTSNPTGIDCGSDCSEDYNFGDDVTLTATPAEGSIFKGWSGSGCTGTGDCTVTMDEQKDISASFQHNFPWPMFLPAISKGRE